MKAIEISFFEASMQHHVNSGMSAEKWRTTGKALWEAMKAGPHYHDGRECQYVTSCPNYVEPRK
jgi:hypothetical protein